MTSLPITSSTRQDADPYDSVEWSHRRAEVGSFVAESVEFPTTWSDAAVNIVAQKYFRVINGVRETSLRQVVARVVETITSWALAQGTLADPEAFVDGLTLLLLHQKMAFNSPVWFNIGVPNVPQQGSACFILSVDDNMASILNWYTEEGMIFKGGSGAGINLSRLRSSAEKLGGGGTASGPVSFMRGADASAGAIKSGGTTRRAAKMVLLDDHHPDLEEFIWCKAKEERKAHALAEAGFDMSLNGSDIHSIQFQNANNSVRLTDAFMRSAAEGMSWDLLSVTTGEPVREVQARDLLHQVAAAAWECADPGVQFTDTINRWHTLKAHSPINASNPCSEYLSIDDSACNLASLNLLAFLDDTGVFDIEAFAEAVATTITAMDAIAGNADYPTESIAENARRYRQLGLGYTNLGALLMTLGVPYDSEDGRAIAGAITAIMTGTAYAMSGVLAERAGPFADWDQHEEATLAVLRVHQAMAVRLRDDQMARNGAAHSALRPLILNAVDVWTTAVAIAEVHGVRNSQATVLAPTGTVSFMMDADTTGIEPDFALVKHKTLVGGGEMQIVNQALGEALERLGYDMAEQGLIITHVRKTGSVVGSILRPEHLPVFATAVGDNAIDWSGHIKMLGAVQPFLSGAASKTINMPSDATVEDMESAITLAWKLGVKCIAIYRDGCKVAQPMSTDDGHSPEITPIRHKLPRTRQAKTMRFTIGGTKGYLTVGEYDDGRPGEIFIKVAKQGSTLASIMDAFAIAVSHGLQYGVPLSAFSAAYIGSMFEPRGFTDDPEIRSAQSIVDYLFRRLELEYGTPADPVITDESLAKKIAIEGVHTGEICSCGSMMLRSGSCWACPACGDTTGCG